MLCDNLDIFNLKTFRGVWGFSGRCNCSGCLEVDDTKINHSKYINSNKWGYQTDGVGLIDRQMVKQMQTHFSPPAKISK